MHYIYNFLKPLLWGFLLVFLIIGNVEGDELQVKLTPEERAWLADHPDITFGFADQYEPFLIKDADGRLSGILVDFLNQMNNRLGTQFKPTGGPWGEILGQIERGELAGTLTMTPMAADSRGLLKTENQFNIYPAIFARSDAPFTINDLNDLRGKSVAIIDPSHFSEKILEPLGDEVDIKRIPNDVELMRMVYEGQVDAALTITAHNYLVAEYGFSGVRPVYIFLEQPIPSLMGVRPDWPELVPILNKGIGSFSQDEINALMLKWINVPIERPASLKLTKAEKAWIDKKLTVRVRIADYPPYIIVKSNEAPQGIVIEYLKLIGERSGITFQLEVTDQPFAEFLESMERFQGPDMTPLIIPTPEREQFLSFSEPYISSPYVIFIRERDKPILDINGLVDKTVAIPRGFVVHDKLTRDYPEIRLALFDTDEKALQAVAVGQADAYIGNLTVASHIIHRRGFSSLRVSASTPFENQSLSMGSRKDLSELTSIISKALVSITEEEKTAVQNKYLAIKYEQRIDKAEIMKWVLTIVVPALSIVLVFVFWNRRMAKEVERRKLAEEMARQGRNAAETASRAKSTFLANMSHELRTPMNAILGFTRILTRDAGLNKDQKERLNIINRSGEHLLGMVDDILSLSKIEAGRVELKQDPFNITQMLEDLGQMMKSRAEDKGLHFTLDLDPALPDYVQGDAGKLRQVLINLLGNAVKFTETGDVWLRVRSQPVADYPERVMLQLEVQDSGPGIPHERLGEVFDSFVQLDHVPETQGGTGLGLTISKTLVDIMGGEITAKSEPGQGALFTVIIPCKLSEAGAEMVDETPVAEVAGLASGQPDWRILLVDDNKENRLLLRDLLSRVGFSIGEAKNGEEAVRMFSQWQPHFIWMDMRMPVMDGYEATRKIRELPGGAGVKIVAVTASVLEEDQGPILAAGCDGLVRKPFQDHEIFEAMESHLEVSYIYSESEGVTAADHKKPIKLTAEMLSELPRELLLELRESTLALDQEATLLVIERIKGQAPETAEGLRTLVESFQMGRLGELLAEN